MHTYCRAYFWFILHKILKNLLDAILQKNNNAIIYEIHVLIEKNQ